MFAIFAFGDSITFGRGDNLNRGWAGRLRKYFEAKDYYNAVYNLGIPGDSSSDLLERFEGEFRSRAKSKMHGDRHVILVGIGTNDSKFIDKNRTPQTKQDEFRNNILKLIRLSRKCAKDIVFIGLAPVDESRTQPYETTYFFNKRVGQYDSIIRDCCRKEDVPFIDIFSEWKKLDYAGLLDDGLHLNPEGYERMYETIKGFLIKHKIID